MGRRPRILKTLSGEELWPSLRTHASHTEGTISASSSRADKNPSLRTKKKLNFWKAELCNLFSLARVGILDLDHVLQHCPYTTLSFENIISNRNGYYTQKWVSCPTVVPAARKRLLQLLLLLDLSSAPFLLDLCLFIRTATQPHLQWVHCHLPP